MDKLFTYFFMLQRNDDYEEALRSVWKYEYCCDIGQNTHR